MTTAERLADRAAFLARTFGELRCMDDAANYRLFDRSGRMTIGYDGAGTVSIILDGRPALFRQHGPGNRVHLLPGCEDTLCELLGIPQEVEI